MKIFTLNGFFNYGNRLQLFALAKTLETIKPEVEVMVYWQRGIKKIVRSLLDLCGSSIGEIIKRKKLKKFTKKYIPGYTNNSECNYSIVGSDQVWNPSYYKGAKYLLNVPNKSIKISYAASIGKDHLTDTELDDFRNALKNYKAISVREKTAQELLQPLTDKKIEVVLDPTLLLDETEYKKLEKKPKDVTSGERYILCYILGDRDYQLAIEKFAKDNGYRVILFSDRKGSSYGIEEFLYLIHHAELVCTDSFHACVFSFIFDRPFVAFKRTGEANYMYSRLQNFMETFKLEDREYNGTEINEDNLCHNYNTGKKILKKEQKKSLEFLKEALGGKK